MIVAEGKIRNTAWKPAKELQWGRNLIVAEGTLATDIYTPLFPALQWGRNLIVAEGQSPASGRAPAPYASMGPQLDSCGRALA